MFSDTIAYDNLVKQINESLFVMFNFFGRPYLVQSCLCYSRGRQPAARGPNPARKLCRSGPRWPVSCNIMTGPHCHLWSGPWPGISDTQVNVARSTVNAVFSILSGERITSSLSVMGSLSVEVGHLNKAIGGFEAILSMLTCGFYTGPAHGELVRGPSGPLS